MRTLRGLLAHLLHPVLDALDDQPLLCDCDERGPCRACEPEPSLRGCLSSS